jgi:hypothetical protein
LNPLTRIDMENCNPETTIAFALAQWSKYLMDIIIDVIPTAWCRVQIHQHTQHDMLQCNQV